LDVIQSDQFWADSEPGKHPSANNPTATTDSFIYGLHRRTITAILLVTTSFSGSNRMDNLLKDHRCPILSRAYHAEV